MARETDRLSVTDRVMTICGSINFRDYSVMDKVNIATKFLDLLDSYSACRDYYFIFHDETDTLHLHYILFFTKQQYVNNILNRFTEALGVEVEAINYRKLLHRNAHLRYILHIDNQSIKEGKKQYPIYDIYTNVNYNLIKCFLDSKDDNDRLDMLTLEAIVVQCEGNEIKVAEFLDSLYDRNYKRIQLILDNYSYVRDKFKDEEVGVPF